MKSEKYSLYLPGTGMRWLMSAKSEGRGRKANRSSASDSRALRHRAGARLAASVAADRRAGRSGGASRKLNKVVTVFRQDARNELLWSRIGTYKMGSVK